MAITGYHARCDWCGTNESEDWIRINNKMYCSSECRMAGEIYTHLCLALAGTWLLIQGISIFGASPMILIVSLVLLVPAAYCSIESYRMRQRTPQGSRHLENSRP